jgi:hypothetical protein
MAMPKLAVDDILDLRAYERVRHETRRQVIDLKQRRRIPVGPFITLVFENTETMRFQVQEMARAEKMLRDDEIAHEVETYNALIPDEGQLSCTLFVEHDDDERMRYWLHRLVGIHESVTLVLPGGGEVRGYDPNAERLTRDDATAAVHFLKFDFGEEERAAFVAGPVTLAIDHPEYREATVLDPGQHAELSTDLRS